MKNKSFIIASAIIKYIKREPLTHTERENIEEWIKNNPGAIKTMDDIFIGNSFNDLAETEKMGDKILSAIKHRKSKSLAKRRKIIASISSVAVVALAVFLFNTNFNLINNKTEVVAVETQNDDNIRLITQDGSNYNLEEVADETKIEGVQIDTSIQTIKMVCIENSSPQVSYNTIVVPDKKEYNIVLSDGTHIWINSGSEITFPKSFENLSVREVELKGEAYFKVAKDSEKPFIVKTQLLNTKVYGTEFMISSYEKDNVQRVSLVEGSVAVSSNVSNHKTELKPGNGVVFNKRINSYSEVPVNINNVLAQKNGYFVFDNLPLSDITNELERWYDYKIIYKDEEIKNLYFYLKSDKKNDIKILLELLKQTKEIDYEITNNIISIKKR